MMSHHMHDHFHSRIARSSRNQETSQRQGPGSFRSRRHLALRRDRSALGFRRRFCPIPFPPRARCSISFPPFGSNDSTTSTIISSRRTSSSSRPSCAVSRATRRPLDDREKDEAARGGVRRARLSGRFRLEENIRKSQSVCGIKLPAGLQLASQLPEPIFTPSTKAEEGHDENIDMDGMRAHSRRRDGRTGQGVESQIYSAAANTPRNAESSSPTQNSNSARSTANCS